MASRFEAIQLFQPITGYAWWAGNARLVAVSEPLVDVHRACVDPKVFWTGAMCLFEVNHLRGDKPLYEQGCILLPHLASLGLGVRASGEIVDSYPFFVVGILHVISSAVLGFGGIFHAVLGIRTTPFFAYRWRVHLVGLGHNTCKAFSLTLPIRSASRESFFRNG